MTTNHRASRCARASALQTELLESRQLLTSGSLPSVANAVSFSEGFYTVSAQSGTASITLDNNELPGLDGSSSSSPEQVYLSFGSSGTAVPGVDYTAGGQTVNFGASEGTLTVQLPILPGSASEGTRTVALDLSTAPGAQPFAVAYLDITHNSDTTPPTVVSTKALTKGPAVTGFVITFSKEMAPGPVQDVENYAIEDPRSIRVLPRIQSMIDTHYLSIKSAVYNSATDSVTLTLAKKTRKYSAFMIMDTATANAFNEADQLAEQYAKNPSLAGSEPQLIQQISPITDSNGNPLDSTRSGTPDGELFALATIGKAGKKLAAETMQPTSPTA
jgi:hypothetical protein